MFEMSQWELLGAPLICSTCSSCHQKDVVLEDYHPSPLTLSTLKIIMISSILYKKKCFGEKQSTNSKQIMTSFFETLIMCFFITHSKTDWRQFCVKSAIIAKASKSLRNTVVWNYLSGCINLCKLIFVNWWFW